MCESLQLEESLRMHSKGNDESTPTGFMTREEKVDKKQKISGDMEEWVFARFKALSKPFLQKKKKKKI